MSSVENQPSETALGAATLRALSVFDERETIKGRDHLAEIFIPEDNKKVFKDPAAREWILKNKVTPGMYEFMIARTVFFDDLVKDALQANIPQVVFLGAGYDSRTYRFQELIKDTRIFELDIHATQQRKKELLGRANISVPEQLAFVSVNFEKDDLGNILAKAGFDNRQETLFVWEGVVYYLPAEIVKFTLDSIKSNAPVNSSVCFDYACVSSPMLNDDGVKEIRNRMKFHYAGEPIRFVVKGGGIERFVSERGYKIVTHLTASEMEKTYLSLPDGSFAGNVPAMFCLVHAAVMD